MFFFFNDTATTEIYTLSLHDALPICRLLAERPADAVDRVTAHVQQAAAARLRLQADVRRVQRQPRSEEHTSELQSRQYLVCRLLLEKKRTTMSDIRGSRIAHFFCVDR